MTLSDFQNWSSDPVTKAFYQACQIRVEDAKELLSASAGIDAVNDNYNRGFIAAYIEMQQFHVEDVE